MEKLLKETRHLEFAVFIILNLLLSSPLLFFYAMLTLGFLITDSTVGPSYLLENESDLIGYCVLSGLALIFLKFFAITVIYYSKPLFPNVREWLNEGLQNKKALILKTIYFDLIVNGCTILISLIIYHDISILGLIIGGFILTGGGVATSYIWFLINKFILHSIGQMFIKLIRIFSWKKNTNSDVDKH